MSVDKEIQVFYPCYAAQPNEYTTLRYDLLKTIIYAQVSLDSKGSISKANLYNPGPLVSYAHNQGVKVVLMFQVKNASSADAILANNTIRTTAINNLLNEVEKNNFDGIDIDLENINVKNSISGKPNKQLMTNFVTNLSNIFRKNNHNYRISMDIGSYYPTVDQIFDLSVLQNKANYVMMMGYDWYGSWSSTAGPNSPMRLDSSKGIVDSIHHYEGLMDKNKLLLGVPWFGYEFATVNNVRLAIRSVNGSVVYISYDDYINYVNNYNPIFDLVWQTPWYSRLDNTGQWYEGHYDDLQSLGIKYDFVNTENLSGIGIWAATHGTNRSDLWKLIQDKFVSPPPTTNKEILAYYPCYAAQPNEYTTLPYDLFTTLGYGQVNVNGDGSISPSTNYNPTPVVQYAHSKGVKVILMFRGIEIPADTMLVNSTARTTLVQNLLNQVRTYGFDGINSNIENIGATNSVNGQPNKPYITAFHTELADKFWAQNPDYKVYISVGMYYPASDGGIDAIFDLHALKDKMNYLKMMGYDWSYSTSSNAGPNGPITTDSGMGIHDSLIHYEGEVGKDKLLLGVPWYGYEWPTIDNTRTSATRGTGIYISYKDYINHVDNYGPIWDSVWQTPWYARKDNTGKWLEGDYDNLQSLGIKYDLALSEGIAGIAIWAVTHGTNRTDLWDLIKGKFYKR